MHVQMCVSILFSRLDPSIYNDVYQVRGGAICVPIAAGVCDWNRASFCIFLFLISPRFQSCLPFDQLSTALTTDSAVVLDLSSILSLSTPKARFTKEKSKRVDKVTAREGLF